MAVLAIASKRSGSPANHDDRAAGTVQHAAGDTAEQHPCSSTVPARTDDDEFGFDRARIADNCLGWVTADVLRSGGDVLLGRTPQCFDKRCSSSVVRSDMDEDRPGALLLSEVEAELDSLER